MLLTNLAILAGVYLGKQLIQSLNPGRPDEALAATGTDVSFPDKPVHHYYASVSGISTVTVPVASIFYPPLILVNIGLISYTTVPILQRTFITLRAQGRINNDGYSALIAVLTLGTGSYFAAAAHNLLYHLSSYLVDQSKADASHFTTESYQPLPASVWLQTDVVDKQVPLEQVKAGDIVIVTSGEVIPVDGLISTGTALVDQQALTGEARPLEKSRGDAVMASTLVLSGRIGIRASHSGKSTRISKLNALLEQTRDYKTQLQLKGEAWSDRAAFPVIVGSAAISPFVGMGPAVALLFSAPTNTVRSMLSVQTSAHMQRAVQQGGLIKDGRVLEELPRIDTILFDKTGTLTESTPEVTNIVACADRDADTLLALAAAAEQRMQHPVARAIVDQAQARQLTLPEVEASQYDLGLGVRVQIAGQSVQVGSQRFIQKSTAVPRLPAVLEQARQEAVGHSFILIAVAGDIQGALILKPRLRPEVPQLIAALRQRGFTQLALVSGDQQAPTEQLGWALGVDTVYSEALPQEKADLVKQLQAQGRRVCFVGDGVNDAIAMKQAQVAVCLSSASSLSSEVAQIVLLNDSLEPLDGLFDAATDLHRDLSRSLYFWIGFSAANALAVPLLAFRPLQSSLLFGAAYGVGLLQSRRTGCP